MRGLSGRYPIGGCMRCSAQAGADSITNWLTDCVTKTKTITSGTDRQVSAVPTLDVFPHERPGSCTAVDRHTAIDRQRMLYDRGR